MSIKNTSHLRSSLTILFFSAIIFSGCKIEPPKPPLVQTMAVLPFDSESNDINAPDIMQRLVYLALKKTPYQLMDIDEVNSRLEKVGIVDGGQLAIVDPKKLGKDFGVQAVMFGYVNSFDYVNVGFYQQKKVGLELKLIDVATGATLWENESSAITPKVVLDSNEAKKEFGKGLAEQFVDKIFKSPLEEEARAATIKTLSTLPGFSFNGFAEDSSSKSKFQETGRKIIKQQIQK